MKKKALLLYFILIYAISGYSQKIESYDLQLYFMGMLKDYKMEYNKSQNETAIIASKRISTLRMNKKDSLEAYNIMKTKKNDSQAKKRFAQILDNYNEYKSDTIIVKSGNSIELKVDDFVKNWNHLKKDIEANPDKNIGLDGYTVRLSLENKLMGYDEIYLRSPNKNYYPEVLKLISELENYYINESKNPVIN